MGYIKWTCFQLDFGMLLFTFHQMSLDATFQNHMAFVVWTHDRFIVAGQFCAHVCGAFIFFLLLFALQSIPNGSIDFFFKYVIEFIEMVY